MIQTPIRIHLKAADHRGPPESAPSSRRPEKSPRDCSPKEGPFPRRRESACRTDGPLLPCGRFLPDLALTTKTGVQRSPSRRTSGPTPNSCSQGASKTSNEQFYRLQRRIRGSTTFPALISPATGRGPDRPLGDRGPRDPALLSDRPLSREVVPVCSRPSSIFDVLRSLW
jgi:hypothetical protein